MGELSRKIGSNASSDWKTGSVKVSVKVSWDAVPDDRDGFVEKCFKDPPREYDLDLAAILCGANGSAVDVVYYAKPSYGDGVVQYTGDSRYGRIEGEDWDGAVMSLDLGSMPSDICMIDLVIDMYGAVSDDPTGGQHLPELENAFALLTDMSGGRETELFKCDFSEEKYNRKHGFVFCRLLRDGKSLWKWEPREETFGDDIAGLQAIVDRYQ
ncbi:MAG: TerD family protein [Synergistaceae bacterium]|nr:TerD family protein [Synergistaceae bacterium]